MAIPADAAVDWVTGIVDRAPVPCATPAAGLHRAYLLIVNTPCECVIGGERGEVQKIVERLGCNSCRCPETATVHCPVVREVAEAYRDLHRLPTTAPPGVRFYSAGPGPLVRVNPDSAAEAILAQALDTVDFPAVVESAYRDGVRVFLEMGPGGFLHAHDRGHSRRPAPSGRARPASPGSDGVSLVLRLLAQLGRRTRAGGLSPLYGPETSAFAYVQPTVSRRRLLSVPVGGRRSSCRRLHPNSLVPTQAPRGNAKPDAPRARPTRGPNQKIRGNSSRTSEQYKRPVIALRHQQRRKRTELLATCQTAGEAHAAYLRLSATLQNGCARKSPVSGAADPTTFWRAGFAHARRGQSSGALTHPARRSPWIVPSVSNSPSVPSPRVLGPEFAVIDSHPTRVRLPDEPLMLVDRILTLEGEPRSLTSGRVVTEHDIFPAPGISMADAFRPALPSKRARPICFCPPISASISRRGAWPSIVCSTRR